MKISVIIPLYNKRDSIKEALRSVFMQTLSPFEVLVINDGSTDGSEKVVFDEGFSNLKLINQENSGVANARNRGINEASGEWIAFLDADDIWMPEYLSTIKKLHDKYPQCPVIATSYLNQDSNKPSRPIILKKIPFVGQDGILNNYFVVASKSDPPFCSDSIVIKKSALLSVGGFPIGIKSGEDLLTWAKLVAYYKIAYTTNSLSIFNRAPSHFYNQKPTRLPEDPDMVGTELIIMAKRNKYIPGIRGYISHWYKMRASIFLRLGMKNKAFREIVRSLSFNPFNLKVLTYFILILVPDTLVNQVFKRFGSE